jgi:hypothetical protein
MSAWTTAISFRAPTDGRPIGSGVLVPDIMGSPLFPIASPTVVQQHISEDHSRNKTLPPSVAPGERRETARASRAQHWRSIQISLVGSSQKAAGRSPNQMQQCYSRCARNRSSRGARNPAKLFGSSTGSAIQKWGAD